MTRRRIVVPISASSAPPPTPNGSGLAWVDTLAPAPADGLDVSSLAADPVDTACRAELRRIGYALHAANPDEDFVAFQVEVAEIDPTHAGWRTMVLEKA